MPATSTVSRAVPELVSVNCCAPLVVANTCSPKSWPAGLKLAHGAGGSSSRPIRSPIVSVNHTLPSGPAVIPWSLLWALIPLLNSVTVPLGVIRPIRWWSSSVNHRLPSEPAAIPSGSLPEVIPLLNSVTAPVRVIRPIRPRPSANHKLPSEPAAIPNGLLSVVIPLLTSVMAPLGVIRPIRSLDCSVNHTLPSRPVVIPKGRLWAVGIGYSVMAPSGEIRPIRPPKISVNHRLPSGPAAISCRSPPSAVVPLLNSVMVPDGVIRPIRPPSDELPSVNHRLPSGPVATPNGPLSGERANSVMSPGAADTGPAPITCNVPNPTASPASNRAYRCRPTPRRDAARALIIIPRSNLSGDEDRQGAR